MGPLAKLFRSWIHRYWLIWIFILQGTVYVSGQDHIVLFDMCFNNGTFFSEERINVQMTGGVSSHSLCACKVNQHLVHEITFHVSEFVCNTTSSIASCPWKMSLYQDGCLDEEFCCQDSWQQKHITFAKKNAHLFILVRQMEKYPPLMKVKFQIHAQGLDGSMTESQCGQNMTALLPCPSPDPTTASTAVPEEASTSSTAEIKPSTIASTAVPEVKPSTKDGTTESSPSSTDSQMSTKGTPHKSTGEEFPIAVVAGASAGAVALIFIIVAMVAACAGCGDSTKDTTDVGSSAFNYHQPRRQHSFNEDLERYQTSLPEPTKKKKSYEPDPSLEVQTYQNVPSHLTNNTLPNSHQDFQY